ncbi:hypothetical protein BDZ89DRAFT_1037687 [Hymenopellis radicata]|nr:hypothetical protein BDZ89DRAFT_1037687 [Hymenopellis radicata]
MPSFGKLSNSTLVQRFAKRHQEDFRARLLPSEEPCIQTISLDEFPLDSSNWDQDCHLFKHNEVPGEDDAATLERLKKDREMHVAYISAIDTRMEILAAQMRALGIKKEELAQRVTLIDSVSHITKKSPERSLAALSLWSERARFHRTSLSIDLPTELLAPLRSAFRSPSSFFSHCTQLQVITTDDLIYDLKEFISSLALLTFLELALQATHGFQPNPLVLCHENAHLSVLRLSDMSHLSSFHLNISHLVSLHISGIMIDAACMVILKDLSTQALELEVLSLNDIPSGFESRSDHHAPPLPWAEYSILFPRLRTLSLIQSGANFGIEDDQGLEPITALIFILRLPSLQLFRFQLGSDYSEGAFLPFSHHFRDATTLLPAATHMHITMRRGYTDDISYSHRRMMNCLNAGMSFVELEWMEERSSLEIKSHDTSSSQAGSLTIDNAYYEFLPAIAPSGPFELAVFFSSSFSWSRTQRGPTGDVRSATNAPENAQRVAAAESIECRQRRYYGRVRVSLARKRGESVENKEGPNGSPATSSENIHLEYRPIVGRPRYEEKRNKTKKGRQIDSIDAEVTLRDVV